MPGAVDTLTSKANRISAFKDVIYPKTDNMRRRVAIKLTTESIDLGRRVGTRDINSPLPSFSSSLCPLTLSNNRMFD